MATKKKSNVQVEMAGYSELAGMALGLQEVKVKMQGRVFSFKVRGLTGRERDEAEEITLMKPPMVRRGGEDVEDFMDPGFRKLLRTKRGMRDAFTLDLCVEGFNLPGQSLEEKATAMKQLSPGLVDKLLKEVEQRTYGDAEILEEANFTSDEGSQGN